MDQERRRLADPAGEPERQHHIPHVLFQGLLANVPLMPQLQIVELLEVHGAPAGSPPQYVPEISMRSSTLWMSVWPQKAIVSASSLARTSRQRVTPRWPIAPSP